MTMTRAYCMLDTKHYQHKEFVIFIAFPLQQGLHERTSVLRYTYRGADKSLARPGRKQATATADFDFHISYL